MKILFAVVALLCYANAALEVLRREPGYRQRSAMWLFSGWGFTALVWLYQ